ADLSAQVLLQPHHGSADVSDDLLRAVDPLVSLIGVGADNTYGHPAPAALDLLHGQGIRIGRTDLDGAVAVVAEPDGPVLVRRAGSTSTDGDVVHHPPTRDGTDGPMSDGTTRPAVRRPAAVRFPAAVRAAR